MNAFLNVVRDIVAASPLAATILVQRVKNAALAALSLCAVEQYVANVRTDAV